MVRIIADSRTAPQGWNERAVSPPGGHVLQSATWALIQAERGLEPRFLAFDDGRVVLATLRHSTGLPGPEAVVRRGPAHVGESPAEAAARVLAIADWARSVGARSLFLDPERPADPTYEAALEAAGFVVTEGPEPSIHVMRRALAPGLDPEALLRSFSKSTRQRIRAAQEAGTSVAVTDDPALMEAFALLLRERADVVGMRLQAGTGFVSSWRRLIADGLARLLLAMHEDRLVGGLLLFRHGGIHATAYSADDAARRRELPGTMHLVRWTAIRDAAAEGCSAIELGGVDLPGRRTPPRPGDPNRGLYEHKRGFGAEWLEREPAHRIVLRPGVERLAAARRRAVDALRRVRR